MPDETHMSALLERAWTHSHEEDQGGTRVYRPAERDFPPARGRESFTLGPGGVLDQVGPGPDDRPVSTSGSWTVTGDRLDLFPNGRSPLHLRVESVDSDRLVVRVIPDAGVP